MLEEAIHDLPVRHLVMSASHNITQKPQRQVDEGIIASAEKYRSRGDMVSYKFQRVAGAQIDELKFLMPLWKDVPLLAHQVISAITHDLTVSVVGSKDVGLVVGAIQDYFKLNDRRLRFVDEGQQTSLANSLTRGRDALDLSDNHFFYFVPLDLPFFFRLRPMLDDEDAAHHIAVVDVNARERIFTGAGELFPRNYYWDLITSNGDGEVTYSIKEPNPIGFSGSIAFDRFFRTIDHMYAHRQGGDFGIDALIQHITRNMVQHPVQALRSISSGGARQLNDLYAWWKQGKRLTLHAEQLEQLGYFLQMAPIRIKAEHQDPFRLKDVDAWHDLFDYALVIRYNGGLQGIHAHATLIEGFQRPMESLKKEIPLLRNFPAYANERARQLGMPLPYGKHQQLIAQPSCGTDIPGTVALLRKFSSTYHSHGNA
ncbi:hypothetical protein HZB02_01255 [Candidatus Woesearchaeota archaeon]|nr:hypothetical protein [Candidatus Woesearchaeota archaeon]